MIVDMFTLNAKTFSVLLICEPYVVVYGNETLSFVCAPYNNLPWMSGPLPLMCMKECCLCCSATPHIVLSKEKIISWFAWN